MERPNIVVEEMRTAWRMAHRRAIVNAIMFPYASAERVTPGPPPVDAVCFES